MKSLLDIPVDELILMANDQRRKYKLALDLCSIMNAKSGVCPEDCKFCSQSSHYKTDIERYPLKTKEEIVKRGEYAKEIGAERFGIVISGRKPNKKELDVITDAISELKEKISVCASLGRLDKDEFMHLKDAGLSRYHHNIETSERYFRNVVSTYTFYEKIKTLEVAKNLGFETCSGGIIGMGETWKDRLDMANLLKSLGVDSVPINILIPIKDTPFENMLPISPIDAIRTIAIFRIILKNKTIRLAGGRESLGPFEATAFFAGANAMIIGEYLTVKGRPVEDDYKLIEEIKRLWA
ncbi:TPA: biotin synthase BioB [bacterium]|nr:biotin synthase BioB [bacterium]